MQTQEKQKESVSLEMAQFLELVPRMTRFKMVTTFRLGPFKIRKQIQKSDEEYRLDCEEMYKAYGMNQETRTFEFDSEVLQTATKTRAKHRLGWVVEK